MRTATESVAVGRRELIVFFSMAFGISWLVWIPAAIASWGWFAFPLSAAATGLIGAFGPTTSAIVVTGTFHGRVGIRRLFERLLIWQIDFRWYAFVLLWPAALSLAATGFHVLLGGTSPDFGHPPIVEFLPSEALSLGLWTLLPFIFVQNLLIGSAMGEEIGWRGFALPRMQAKWDALHAGALLGVLWWAWHLPIYMSQGHPMSNVFFGWTLLGIIADAILFTWVFNNTKGSLLPPLLFHASIAVTGLYVAAQPESFLIALLLKGWVVAVVVWKAGAAHLSRGTPDVAH